jgi:hypothetical protein
MGARIWGAAGPVLASGCGLMFAAGLVAGVILSPWILPDRDPPRGDGPPASQAAGPRGTAGEPCDCGPADAPSASPRPGEAPPRTAARMDSGDPLVPPRPRPAAPQPEEAVVPAPPPPEPEVERAVGDSEPVDPLAALVARGLSVPVLGVQREDLRDSYAELRGASRRHEAIDILAPRDTPVVAVEDGTIAKLFTSHGGGGLTIYQFDEDAEYAYYYAHLERYAGGLEEGDRVRRGQVIGFVGTSGNAPPDTPHLHFAVYRLNEDRRWWEGDPLNPYEVLRPGRVP